MPPAGFELNLSWRTALDRAATGTGHYLIHNMIFKTKKKLSNIKLMFGFSLWLSKKFSFEEEFSEILQIDTGIHVECSLLLSDFNETWIFSADFRKILE